MLRTLGAVLGRAGQLRLPCSCLCVGARRRCGLLGDSDKKGATDSGETTVPSGYKFKSIAAGQTASCGVIATDSSGTRQEDEAICWGKGFEIPYEFWESAFVPTLTPTPQGRTTPANTPTPTPNAQSVRHFPHIFVTPTPGVPKFAGPITTHGLVTCGILKEDYIHKVNTAFSTIKNSSVIRDAGTPYCEGWVHSFGAEVKYLLWGTIPYQHWFDYLSDVRNYKEVSTAGYTTCAITGNGEVECHGMDDFNNTVPPRIATVKPGTSHADTYDCSGVTYNGASPALGGAFPNNVVLPTATYTVTPTPDIFAPFTPTPTPTHTPNPAWTATPTPTMTPTPTWTPVPNHYVSIPGAALNNDTVIAVRMTGGGTIPNTQPESGYDFRGESYTVAVNNSNCQAVNSVTINRSVDICIPKPTDRAGRWFDWKLFEIDSNNSATGSALNGWTDLNGKVCAEVNKLPITIAAASKAIPTHTPTPTPTATYTSHDHDGDHANDLVVEEKVGTSELAKDVYVRVHGEALPSGGSKLQVRPVDPRYPLDNLGSVFKVGDLYVEINLVTSGGVDIGGNLNPPAEICIAAPLGLPGSESLYHQGDGATEWNELPPLDPALLTGEYVKYGTGDYACGVSDTLSTFVGTSVQATPTPTPTATPVGGQRISRIKPNVSAITLSAGDKVRLSVDIYGMQDILDNSLADDVDFDWSVEPSGGSFEESDYRDDDDSDVDEREALFTAPSQAGTYTVKILLDKYECRDDVGYDDGCFAEIVIKVRGLSAPASPTATPANPAGEIPLVIVDDYGNQYEVFTPVDGGEFIGEDVSVVGDPGAVPNGEIIGVRADADGVASNVGQTHQRVTLDGMYYRIAGVDAFGVRLKGYVLDDPLEVCVPVPDRLRRNISSLAMVSERADGTFALLSSNVRLSDSGVNICGKLSQLSARIAVGQVGSPSGLPSPTPLPTPEAPDTGGTTPFSTAALVLILALITSMALMSWTLLRGRKQPTFSPPH